MSSNESGAYQKSVSVHNQLKGNLPAKWSAINSETSDFAISNSVTHSVFLLNSACRKYEASNLNSLSAAILAGVDIQKVIEKKIIIFQGRDAMDMTVLGRLDGVDRFFHVLTTQKNNCIYDLVLISTTEANLQNDNNDFQGFIQRIELN
jgi:hypothetical protein